MDITIDRQELSAAVDRISGYVQPRALLPHYAGVRITATVDDNGVGRIRLHAASDEGHARLTVVATVDQPGDELISAKLFNSIVKRLPDAPVRIVKQDDGRVKVSCGKFASKLRPMQVDNFPPFPQADDSAATVTLKADDFARAVALTASSASADAGRPILTAVNVTFDADTGQLHATATDSYRLATVSVAADGSRNTVANVPAASISKAGKNAAADGGTVTLKVPEAGTGVVTIMLEGAEVALHQVAGTYPEWQRIVPDGESYLTDVVVDKDALTAVIDRVSLLQSAAVKKVAVDVTDGKMTFASSDDELGDAADEVAAAITGDQFTGTFNTATFAAGVALCPSEQVKVRLRQPKEAVVIVPDGDDSADFLYLAMPLQG